MRFKFHIAYNGHDFFGWQKQKKQISIQSCIEDNLRKLFPNLEIEIIGCGRTDTGVHAYSYFFHSDLDNRYEVKDLMYKLNKMLPQSISIYSIEQVNSDFHARFDAKTRSYRYFFTSKKNPFDFHKSLYISHELDLKEMEKACAFLIGKQDFTSFSKLHTDVKNNFCAVFEAKIIQTSEYDFYFEISANRFLRNMVRAIVGTLITIGEKKNTAEHIKTVIEGKDRALAGKSAPAHGLFLWEITY